MRVVIQENYEKMMSRINSVGLDPGTIIIDDMWQTDYGTNEVDKEKWPDLRAFVDKRHSEGRRVLLWWRLWNCDGLPAEECIKSDGLSVTADPTSAAYRLRIKRIVHRLLSSDDECMDCDGFKLDYIYRFPSFRDREATPHQKGIYGLELLRLYYKTIYDEVKKVKLDAMINTSFAHPYFADLYDVIRLHDYSSAQRSTMSMMRFRAKTVRTVFPYALIANSFTGCSQEVISHNLCACEVGIPSLYSLSNLSDSDLKKIRNAWDNYEKKNIRGK